MCYVFFMIKVVIIYVVIINYVGEWLIRELFDLFLVLLLTYFLNLLAD